MKKFIILFFFIFLPFQTFAFSDTQNSEFRPYIESMVSEKLISWYSDGKFRPSNSVSFFESLKISTNTTAWKQEIWNQNEVDFYKNIYKNNFLQNEKFFEDNQKITRDFAIYIILKNIWVNLENQKIQNNFLDVNSDSIFANYINFAKNNWIIWGYGNWSFGPNNQVTRWEFSKMSWLAIRENSSKIFENYQNLKSENSWNQDISQNSQNKNNATVISVTDWDTIKIQNSNWKTEKIRIVWFDAPESFDTRFWYIECYGPEASNFLKNYLKNWTEIEVIYHWWDKYNRDLAEIFINWKSVSETMLENWLGWVYRKWVKPSNYQKLLELEEEAKNKKIGLFAENTCNGERKPTENINTILTPKIENNPKIYIPAPDVYYRDENDECYKSNSDGSKTIASEHNCIDIPKKNIKNNNSNYSKDYSEYNSNHSKKSNNRVCYTWPKWWRYYINSSGKKVYNCN